MTKAEEFKMKLKSSFYYFDKEDYTKCLWHLKTAGDMVLKKIKKNEEKVVDKNNIKLPIK